MQINPGGRLNLADVVGRDVLVAAMFAQLQTQSLLVVAERRMGKTHVLHKLRAEAAPDWLVLFRDVEDVRSAAEFVRYVVADLEPHFGKVKQFRDWLNAIVGEAGGMQVGPLKLPNFPAAHWKKVLQDAVTYIQTLPGHKRIIFLWDELPWMLQKIAQSTPQDAMELMDVLRALRQQNDKVRMVYTGSIGLHHIIRQLKAQGYNNEPTNDMQVVEVPALQPEDAQRLSENLLIALEPAGVPPELADALAHSVDCMPYYIHHVANALLKQPALRGAALTPERIAKEVETIIRSPHDPWNLEHFESRTVEYYGTQRDACLALLDTCAMHDDGIEIQDAIRSVKAAHPEINPNDWLTLTRLLQRDHYLVRDEQTGRLRFKFGVILRWWRWQRGIQAQ